MGLFLLQLDQGNTCKQGRKNLSQGTWKTGRGWIFFIALNMEKSGTARWVTVPMETFYN